MATMDTVTRPALHPDLAPAVDTLVRAFADYPLTRHTIGADQHLARLRRFHELFLNRIGFEHGKIWVTDDAAAVAVWTTPETTSLGQDVFTELAPRFAEIAGDRAHAHAEAEAVMSTHRPTEPAWFLGAVGVDPRQQGRGLGTAVLRPGIEAAERAGTAAFLETSQEANVAFYERLGFESTAEYTLPDGPRTWSMLRRAR